MEMSYAAKLVEWRKSGLAGPNNGLFVGQSIFAGLMKEVSGVRRKRRWRNVILKIDSSLFTRAHHCGFSTEWYGRLDRPAGMLCCRVHQ